MEYTRKIRFWEETWGRPHCFSFFARYILLVEKIILWDVCELGSPIVWKAARRMEAAVHNSYE